MIDHLNIIKNIKIKHIKHEHSWCLGSMNILCTYLYCIIYRDSIMMRGLNKNDIRLLILNIVCLMSDGAFYDVILNNSKYRPIIIWRRRIDRKNSICLRHELCIFCWCICSQLLNCFCGILNNRPTQGAMNFRLNQIIFRHEKEDEHNLCRIVHRF